MKKINPWKYLFFILLIINIVGAVYVGKLVFSDKSNDERLPSTSYDQEKQIQFAVSTTKDHLNTLIHTYLKERSLNYNVVLEDAILVTGTVPVFDWDIAFEMKLIPDVQSNGDLILKPIEMKLGEFRLPQKTVMASIKDNFEMPKWITIYPNKNNIYVAITEMELKNQFRLRVEAFDLERDNMKFTVMMDGL